MTFSKQTTTVLILCLVSWAHGMPNPFPLPDPHPSPLPSPQSSGDSSEDEPYRTDLCDAVTYDGFFDRFSECETKANAIIFDTFLAGGDLWDGICASIKEVVDVCVPTIGPECWSSQDLTNVKYNVIKNHFRRANNDTSLGRPFIDSCPILFDNENEMVKQVTGSTKCSFNQYESSREELRQSFFTRIMCTVQDRWRNTCTKNYLQCLGPEIKMSILKDEEQLKAVWTSQITDFEPGFTFDKDCEGLFLPNF
ncbi:hypothetical protein TCAL_10605 [Tigriopus californicus]|uniref:DUF19 domain-containing protein n=1 Tax=Tigriopus californicus TaxID=6832 RepID=A0A553P377_TIGCA|nr:hypothetical protein TCAL_10605 [Tigriopus californicus]|eukprot:TCALIF_10605-PA protein Name:"Protein of unknown function" AED:0.04 eAED:0.04 QI:127/0.5/0.66/1/1/1/3/45/251